MSQEPENPTATSWARLIDAYACPYALRHGQPGIRERRGATYRQLAYAAHLCDMTKRERKRWYKICAEIPLSERHASHIIELPKSRESTA